MLYDRPYMRETPYRSAKPVYVWLIGINVVMFFLQMVLGDARGNDHPFVERFLMLSPEGMQSGMIWQLLTFQFLHGGLFHILINCLILYMFGRHVEAQIGAAQFLKLYLLSGVLGGLLQVVMGFIWPMRFGGSVLGASAGVCGVVAAFATIHPEERLTMLLFFIIPVTLKAKFLLLANLIIAFLGIVAPPDGVAHAAHLGGIIGGVCFVRYVLTGRIRIPDFKFPSKRRSSGSRIIDVKPTKESFFKKSKSAEPSETPKGDFISREVDPILDKIAEHGIHSLTDRERKILEAARSRMSKR